MARLWQKRDLEGADVGDPGPLPKPVAGWTVTGLLDLERTPEKWGLRGFVFVPAPPPPPPVPVEIARLWARLALQAVDLLDIVEAAVADADLLTRIYWADAASFRRDSPILAMVSAGLGLTDANIDDLFRSAATLAKAAGADLV